MSNTTQFELEIKNFLIEILNLEDITADDIDAEAPLFGEGLGLDSVDALEIGIALKKRYGISFDPKSETTRNHFFSVRSLATFLETQKKQ